MFERQGDAYGSLRRLAVGAVGNRLPDPRQLHAGRERGRHRDLRPLAAYQVVFDIPAWSEGAKLFEIPCIDSNHRPRSEPVKPTTYRTLRTLQWGTAVELRNAGG